MNEPLNRSKTWLGLGFMLIACLALLALAACSGKKPADSTPPPSGNGAQQSPGDGAQDAPGDQDAHGGDGVSDAIFSLFEIEVGDTVAGMRVEAIEAVEDDGSTGRDPHNVLIRFSGRKEITGRFTYHPPTDPFLANTVWMHIDDRDGAGLPHMLEDTRYTWFCFYNQDDAHAVFIEPGAGTATVVIDDYTIVYYPSEVWNTATLVEARSVISRPLVKSITTYPEGMEHTSEFQLVDVFWLPFLTYIPVDWQYQAIEDENGQGVLILPPFGDTGQVEIWIYHPEIEQDKVEELARTRLEEEGFLDPEPGFTDEDWPLVFLEAGDSTGPDAGSWRRANLYIGKHGDRYFHVLDQLNRLEAGDGWGPIVNVLFDEWLWTKTGELLREPLQ